MVLEHKTKCVSNLLTIRRCLCNTNPPGMSTVSPHSLEDNERTYGGAVQLHTRLLLGSQGPGSKN